MYGVVLWSNPSERKAVIWCEDHGDLAYYSESGHNLFEGVSLDAGDLIEFDVSDTGPMRRASNPAPVADHFAPSIASRLRNAAALPETKPAAPKPRYGSQVVSFPMAVTA